MLDGRHYYKARPETPLTETCDDTDTPEPILISIPPRTHGLSHVKVSEYKCMNIKINKI